MDKPKGGRTHIYIYIYIYTAARNSPFAVCGSAGEPQPRLAATDSGRTKRGKRNINTLETRKAKHSIRRKWNRRIKRALAHRAQDPEISRDYLMELKENRRAELENDEYVKENEKNIQTEEHQKLAKDKILKVAT